MRDLLWLTVVSALSVGYWLEYRRHAPRRYDVYVSDDGKTLQLLDNQTGVIRLMKSDSLDRKKIMQDIIRDSRKPN
jgi:hypothetical protein